MEPIVNVITTLTRIQGEGGAEQYVGTIDMSALRKAKIGRLEIVVVPLCTVPKTLSDLINKACVANADALMFGALARQE
ncbi:MAG TPA: hypothetical protein PKH07_14815, partial [bacterium]|nr:hypothetical protein [bacterium]